MTTTIDHPLREAVRALETGFLDPEALDRIREEWLAGPRTPAHMRESIFEILGPGYRGCVPLAITEVLDPDTVRDGLDVPDRWLAIGVVDDASVLALADGSWFGVAAAKDADRAMGGIFLPGEEEALEARPGGDGGRLAPLHLGR